MRETSRARPGRDGRTARRHHTGDMRDDHGKLGSHDAPRHTSTRACVLVSVCSHSDYTSRGVSGDKSYKWKRERNAPPPTRTPRAPRREAEKVRAKGKAVKALGLVCSAARPTRTPPHLPPWTASGLYPWWMSRLWLVCATDARDTAVVGRARAHRGSERDRRTRSHAARDAHADLLYRFTETPLTGRPGLLT